MTLPLFFPQHSFNGPPQSTLNGPDYLSKKSSGFVLKRYFVEYVSQNSKMERKMYGSEFVFEIINFKWNHALKFFE